MSHANPSLLDRLGRWTLRRLGAQSLYFDAHGTKLHAYHLPPHPSAPPDAPPLVLMHGVGSSASTFARLLRRLRPHFSDIYLPEAPAHGQSAVPPSPMTPEALFALVRELLDAVPRAPFVLYGNSLGGAASFRYAIERPERVLALVLLSPAGAGTSADELKALVETFELPTRASARRFMGRLFEHPRWYHGFAAGELRRRLHEPALREFFAGVGSDSTLDPSAVEHLPMPVLLMWGGAETLLPASNRAWFKAHLPPHATLSEPAHFAHSAYIEHPGDVAREILGFLTKTKVLQAAPDAPEIDTARDA